MFKPIINTVVAAMRQRSENVERVGFIGFMGDRREQLALCHGRIAFLPNVKDEPRPRPARLLRPSIALSVFSFDLAFVSRRRDGRGRWLWRLVRLPVHRMRIPMPSRFDCICDALYATHHLRPFSTRRGTFFALELPCRRHVRSSPQCRRSDVWRGRRTR